MVNKLSLRLFWVCSFWGGLFAMEQELCVSSLSKGAEEVMTEQTVPQTPRTPRRNQAKEENKDKKPIVTSDLAIYLFKEFSPVYLFKKENSPIKEISSAESVEVKKIDEMQEKIRLEVAVIKAILQKIFFPFDDADLYAVDLVKMKYLENASQCYFKPMAYIYHNFYKLYKDHVNEKSPVFVLTTLQGSSGHQKLRKICIPLVWFEKVNGTTEGYSFRKFDIESLTWDNKSNVWKTRIRENNACFAHLAPSVCIENQELISREKIKNTFVVKEKLKHATEELFRSYYQKMYNIRIYCCSPQCINEYGVNWNKIKDNNSSQGCLIS